MSETAGINTRERVELGIRGEEAAARFLSESGYKIIKRNVQIGHSDIDILAEEGESLVFVEVRTKSKVDRGMPEDSLNNKKLRQMRKTAELYIAWNHYEGVARLDAVCIVIEGESKIMHLEHYIGVG
ncbi:MAG: YraN family protein [Proteobacteria bacterium]|nr:YraN family protein [Pseudomonadota bacterium]